jgi:hypothetical protein
MPIQQTPTYAAFSELLHEWEDSDLFRLAEDVAALLGTPGWERLCELMAAGREQVQQNLERAPIDQATIYARFNGFLTGTRVFPEVAESVLAIAKGRHELIEQMDRQRQEESARV